MDIYDVPITEVIEQYLAYVSTLQAMRLEVAGEYMVMASQLMLIKSRKLLPKVAEVSDLEDDLEQDLLSQIEEYRKFKLLGEQLEVKHQDRAQSRCRSGLHWQNRLSLRSLARYCLRLEPSSLQE